MRIGIIGYYGHANAGDERILHCIRSYFARHELFVTSGFGDAWKKIEQLNACDFVLIGGGGLILRGHGRHTRLIEQLKPPFGCIGISVEAVHADNMTFIDAIKQQAEFIYVRDRRSQELLDHHPKVITGPDLTFLYPYPPVEPASANTCGVNLRPWYYWNAEYRGRLHQLIERLDRRYSFFKKIYFRAKWEPEKAVRILQENYAELIPFPLYTGNGDQSDTQLLRQFFPWTPAIFCVEDYARCRNFAGMRLHSLIFACQMGIPFLSLSYQPKNEEFCKSVGLEELSISLYDLSRLAEKIRRLQAGYAGYRERLLAFSAEQHNQAAGIMRQIAGQISL